MNTTFNNKSKQFHGKKSNLFSITENSQIILLDVYKCLPKSLKRITTIIDHEDVYRYMNKKSSWIFHQKYYYVNLEDCTQLLDKNTDQCFHQLQSYPKKSKNPLKPWIENYNDIKPIWIVTDTKFQIAFEKLFEFAIKPQMVHFSELTYDNISFLINYQETTSLGFNIDIIELNYILYLDFLCFLREAEHFDRMKSWTFYDRNVYIQKIEFQFYHSIDKNMLKSIRNPFINVWLEMYNSNIGVLGACNDVIPYLPLTAKTLSIFKKINKLNNFEYLIKNVYNEK